MDSEGQAGCGRGMNTVLGRITPSQAQQALNLLAGSACDRKIWKDCVCTQFAFLSSGTLGRLLTTLRLMSTMHEIQITEYLSPRGGVTTNSQNPAVCDISQHLKRRPYC